MGHHAAQAAGCRDETVVIALQQLPVDARLVVVTLEVGGRRELDEVPVALCGLSEDGQVVVELLASLPLAARVVDAAPPYRALVTGLRCHVGLGADDRRDAALAALFVEVEDAVHVAVIGDRQSGLAIGHRSGNQISDPRRPVEHRVLGVRVQVDERCAAVCCSPGRLDHYLPTPCPQARSTACGRTTALSLALAHDSAPVAPPEGLLDVFPIVDCHFAWVARRCRYGAV